MARSTTPPVFSCCASRRVRSPIWCTDNAYADLTRGNPIFGVLGHYCGIERRALRADGSAFAVGALAGVEWRALAVRLQARALLPAP